MAAVIVAAVVYFFAEDLSRAWETMIYWAREPDPGQIDHIARKHGLTREQRERLHREISKQGYSLDEIEDIAVAIRGTKPRMPENGGE